MAWVRGYGIPCLHPSTSFPLLSASPFLSSPFSVLFSSSIFFIFLFLPSLSHPSFSLPLYLILPRLSLRREPDPVTRRKGTGGQSLGGMAKSQLRTSKSHEDLLTPFTSISLDSLSTSGSHTDSKVWTPQFQRRELATRHSSIPQIEIQGNSPNYPGPSFASLSEHQVHITIEDSPSLSKKLKTSTLPSSRGESFSGSCSSGSGPPSRTSSEKRRRSMSDNSQWKPLELPLPPEPPTNVFKKPHLPSPSLKWRRERGHLKSHSLGNK